jgi:hypothetical protein
MNQKIKKFISIEKVKFTRGYSYISTIGIPFLVARSMGDMTEINWIWFFIPVVLLIWLAGEIDWKYGFFGNELEVGLTKNPEWIKKMEKEKEEKK